MSEPVDDSGKNDSKNHSKNESKSASSRKSSLSFDRTKTPPIKAHVGTAPPPEIEKVTSKVGSFQNASHQPKGGDKKIESKKLKWEAKSKVGSLDNAYHKPGGGDKKIFSQKLNFRERAHSKIGSRDNLSSGTKNKSSEKRINAKGSLEKVQEPKSLEEPFKSPNEKKKIPPIKAVVGIAPPPDINNVEAKVGSLDNAKHKPGGGDKKIFNQIYYKDNPSKADSKDSLDKQLAESNSSVPITSSVGKAPPPEIDNVEAKVGSLDNAKHKPGGGDKKIFNQIYYKDNPSQADSKDSLNKQLAESNNSVPITNSNEKKDTRPKKPSITNTPSRNIKKVTSKIGSLDNISHKPKGGDKKIFSEKLTDIKVKSKVGSKTNINHKPGGGKK